MACYLSSTLPSPSNNAKRKRVLELGSGVGYLALVMAGVGYDVLASDVEPVVSSVLRQNVEDGGRVLRCRGRAEEGDLEVVELDWTHPQLCELDVDGGGVDMIVATDTIYHHPLVRPFFETMMHFSNPSKSWSGPTPLVVLAIERRDGEMVDRALDVGKEMGFDLRRVGRGRVEKGMEKAGWGGGEGWEGVEIWRGRWKGPERRDGGMKS